MALATFTLTSVVSPVDSATVVTNLTVTGPDGVALPVIIIPSGAATVATPTLALTGTYTYMIANVDANGAPVTNGGVAYPTVTGSFVNPTAGLTASLVTAATVVVA
jgi:hypothetical protein